jgi:hypothetical protein
VIERRILILRRGFGWRFELAHRDDRRGQREQNEDKIPDHAHTIAIALDAGPVSSHEAIRQETPLDMVIRRTYGPMSRGELPSRVRRTLALVRRARSPDAATARNVRIAHRPSPFSPLASTMPSLAITLGATNITPRVHK